jgi:hypothetical protein
MWYTKDPQTVKTKVWERRAKSIHVSWFQSLPQNNSSQDIMDWAPMAHTYNSSCLGGWDWEDHGLRPAQTNRWWDPTSCAAAALLSEHLLQLLLSSGVCGKTNKFWHHEPIVFIFAIKCASGQNKCWMPYHNKEKNPIKSTKARGSILRKNKSIA